MPDPFEFHRTDWEIVSSTSDIVRRLLIAGGRDLPLLVTAQRQTAGRGQRENSWYSDEGSLTFSLGLDPLALGIAQATWPRIALTAAVAIVDAAEAIGVPSGVLGVRWPNDVETASGSRKIAGILPEPVDTADGPRLVLGIGLNVTTNLEAAAPEVRAMATTLAALLDGKAVAPREDILDAVLAALEMRLGDLARQAPALPTRWNELDLLQGRGIALKPPAGDPIRGRARGIDANGALRIELDGGRLETVLAGQVLRS